MANLGIKQIETNIGKMLADVEHSRKTFTLEIIKIVIYALIGGSTATIAFIKIFGN